MKTKPKHKGKSKSSGNPPECTESESIARESNDSHKPACCLKADTEKDKKADWHWVFQLLTAIFTFLTLVVVSFYTYYAYQEEVAANKSADAAENANRPYIGINGVDVSFKGEDGAFTSPTPKSSAIGFRVNVKNFGPIPGTSMKYDWRVWEDVPPIVES